MIILVGWLEYAYCYLATTERLDELGANARLRAVYGSEYPTPPPITITDTARMTRIEERHSEEGVGRACGFKQRSLGLLALTELSLRILGLPF